MHMTRTRPGTLLALLIAGALGACSPQPLPGEPNASEGRTVVRQAEEDESEAVVLASVEGRAITLEEFERRLAQRGQESQEFFADGDLRPQFLERLLWFEVMANAAQRNGWNDAPEAAVLEPDYVARAVLQEATPPDASEVTDEAVAERWEEMRAEIMPVERRRVYVSLYPDRAAAMDAERTLRTWIEEERDQPLELFGYEARTQSMHAPTRARSGDLGWVVRAADGGNVDPALEALVFGADANGIAGIVDVDAGAALVYVGSVIEARGPSQADAEPRIRTRIAAEQTAAAQRALLDRWRESASVSINADAVASLGGARIDGGPTTPIRPRRYAELALAGGPDRTFGLAWNSLAAEADADYRQTPFAADFVATAPEGSGEPANPDPAPDR